MTFLSTIVLGLLVSGSVFAQAEPFGPWAGFSDPEIMSSGFTHKFSTLPLEGGIPKNSTKGWSGDYWPSKRGSINIRWNSPNGGYGYNSPSRSMVMSMSQEQLAQLSPSEKFDILRSRYDYPLKNEVSGIASPWAKEWNGICHGWAPASLHHNEPTPKVLKNAEGVMVPFGSADIKAIVSYYYAYHNEVDNTHQMGLRCFFGAWLGGTRACNEDLNAGALHIVMGNRLGLKQEGFLMDKDRYNEVWNQAVVGYKTTIIARNLRPSRYAAYNTASEVRVNTQLYYVEETVENTWEPVVGTDKQKIGALDLYYRLELDAQGNILGGAWEGAERPDFIWDTPLTSGFTGEYQMLHQLMND